MPSPAYPAPIDSGTPTLIVGVWSVITKINELLEWIKALTPAGRALYDTGWVDIPYTTGGGWTAGTPGQLAYRCVGTVVYLRGGVTGTFTSGTYHEIGTLPAGMRPTQTMRPSASAQTGKPAMCQINGTDGKIFVCWNNLGTSTSAPQWISTTTDFLVS